MLCCEKEDSDPIIFRGPYVVVYPRDQTHYALIQSTARVLVVLLGGGIIMCHHFISLRLDPTRAWTFASRGL